MCHPLQETMNILMVFVSTHSQGSVPPQWYYCEPCQGTMQTVCGTRTHHLWCPSAHNVNLLLVPCLVISVKWYNKCCIDGRQNGFPIRELGRETLDLESYIHTHIYRPRYWTAVHANVPFWTPRPFLWSFKSLKDGCDLIGYRWQNAFKDIQKTLAILISSTEVGFKL